jgi:plastocyanin
MPEARALLLLAGAAMACARSPAYQPRTRAVTVTMVPLLVKEQQRTFAFLARDFARGGVLDGKEVYAFSPSTITVVAGDTLRLELVNPEDDEHTFVLPGCTAEDRESFVLPDCGLHLPGQTTTHATYVARRTGVFPITCDLAAHQPFMSGQLVVLGPAAVSAEGAMR